MNTLLAVTPTEALPLIERVHAHPHVAQDHPLIFGAGAPGRVIAVGDAQDDPRSVCAILARDFTTPQGTVRVGLIGSVSTDPAHEGRGLATRVLVEAEAALVAQGCQIALLWANDPRFYYARGYRPVGAEVDVLLSRGLADRLPDPSGVRAARPEDRDAIHALYLRHESRVERSLDETRALLGVPGMKTLVRERDGAIAAYACLGRGPDLGQVIHEWSGDVEDVLALCRAHLEAHFRPAEDDGTLYLMAPLTASALVERLTALGFDAALGVLGLGRVLDHAACAELLHGLLKGEGVAEFHAGPEGPGVRLSCPGGQGVLNDDLLLGLLFPAQGLHADVDDLRRSFGLERAAFPMDLFAWGLDSI